MDQYTLSLAQGARLASRQLALADTDQKNHWLDMVARQLRDHVEELLRANRSDLDTAMQMGLTGAQLERLTLDAKRVAGMASAIEDIARLPDPIGEIMESTLRPNGLEIKKVRVPLGVVLFIYESRPNVTTDAAGLCVKSGNAVILRGGKEAILTNQAINKVLRECLQLAGLPTTAVQLVGNTDRAVVDHLLSLAEYIDLAIPRGGEGLIRRVAERARMPVMKHYQGICHVYVHEAAYLEMARNIVLNAKCQRPGVCNAAESLLVDRAIAARFLPGMVAALQQAGVEIRGCPETCRLSPGVVPVTERDFSTEYLDLKMSVRVVGGLDDAIDHIGRYGSAHTDAIVTQDGVAATQFAQRVDSSAVLINASTRFNDGGEFGFGAEIGISTDKYHARGPCSLRELTSYKYVVTGTGQIRN